jgi:hypothetical protein
MLPRLRTVLPILGTSLVVACGPGAGSPPATGTAPPPSGSAPASTISASTTTASTTVPTASAAPANPPPGAQSAEPGDLTREELLAASARDDAPAVLARLYDATPKLTPAQRWSALGDIGAKYKQSVTDRASLPAFVAWLKTRKEIEAAGIHDLDVWGRFVDGRLFVMLAVPPNAPPPTEPTGPQRRGAKTLPASKTVIGIDTVGADTAANDGMVTWMTSSGHSGKSYAGSATVTVPFVATAVAGQALLNWNSHGGFGADRDGHDQYVLQSATPVRDCAGNRLEMGPELKAFKDAATCADKPLEDYFAKGELAYTSATIWQNGRIPVPKEVDGVTPPDPNELTKAWTYGFTQLFVRHRFHLAPHAIVVVDACKSGTPEAAGMRGAFLSAGADVVMAWGDDVAPNDGIRAAKGFWYAMLGRLGDPILDSTPPLRPWDLEGTLALLRQWKWDVSTVDGNRALFRPSPRTAKAIAVASLAWVDIDEAKQRITLHGDFGDDRPANAKVTIGGADCPITSFANDQVECDPGTDFKVGDVLFLADGRKSNALPLTGWKIGADYVMKMPPGTPGNLSQSWHFEAHIRADVHRHRDAVLDAQGKEREPFDVMGAHDSTCTPVAAGAIAAGLGGVAGGSGNAVKETYGRPDPKGTCVVVGRLDPRSKKLVLGIFAMGAGGAGYTITAPGQTVLAPTPPAILMPEMKDADVTIPTMGPGTGQTIGGLTLAFDASWTLTGRKGPAKTLGRGAEVTFEVKTTPATAAPTEKTAQ